MHTRSVILAAAAAVASIIALAPAAVAQTRFFRCDENDEGKGPLHYIVGPNEMRIYRSPEQTRSGKGFLSANLCQEPGTTCSWENSLRVLTLQNGSGIRKAFGVVSSGGLYSWNRRNGQQSSVLCEAVDAIPYAERWDQADWINGQALMTRIQ